MQDCKDGSGLQFIKSVFVTGGQVIQIDVRVEFVFLAVTLFLQLIFLCFHHFQPYFQKIKQFPGYNHENATL